MTEYPDFSPMQKLLDWEDSLEPDIDPTAFEINFDPTKQRMSGYAVHGNTPFDVPFISEISEGFWQGGCETGLVLPSFIDHLISLYPWEKYTIRHEVRSELYVRMYDSEHQAFDQVESIARWVSERRKDGNVLVHCQAGLNRSSLVAARALMLSDHLTADDAIYQIRSKRSPACLCNRSFEKWLRSLDDV